MTLSRLVGDRADTHPAAPMTSRTGKGAGGRLYSIASKPRGTPKKSHQKLVDA
jgi:hypothetical protein